MTLSTMSATLLGHDIDLLRVGGAGPRAYFLHANGYPPAAYAAFLGALGRQLDVTAMPLRPLWAGEPPRRTTTWRDLGSDLVALLDDREKGPVIAIGHSMGATASIYAAAARSDLFSAIVLLEPAMVRRWQAAVLRCLPYGAVQRLEPARSTLRKRDHWPDRAAFLESCRRSGLYTQCSTEALDTFCDAALQPERGGLGLRFGKDWEAHFYCNPPWPGVALSSVTVPVVGVRGASSIYLDDARWNACVATQPGGWFEQLEHCGHLLPLERPGEAAAAVVRGLSAAKVL